MSNKKSISGVSILICCLSFICLIFLQTPPGEAANANKELSKIQKQKKTISRKVKESLKKEKSVIEKIKDIDSSIKVKEDELKSYDMRISETQLEIVSLSKEVNSLKLSIKNKRSHLKARMKALYKQQYGGHALALISANDYQDIIKISKYISLVAYYDERLIKKYNDSAEKVILKRQKLEDLHDSLRTDKKRAAETQKALKTDRRKKDKLLAMLRSKRKAYEKKIKELEKSSKKLKRMIARLKKKKLPKSISGKGFKAMRGRLPWPVAGKVASPFGKYKDPEFNITVFKNGIEIKPNKGKKPRAIAGGRVVYADWFKGYGLLLIVDHGSGYHSLYGNLSEIFLKTGDILIKGTVVGKIGKSRLLDFPTLYFEIRHKGKPENPLKWLKKNRPKKRIRIK